MRYLCVICLIVVFFTVSQGSFISRKFSAKLEFDNKISNDGLLGEFSSQSLIQCGLNCQRECTCSLFGYNTILKNCRLHRGNFTSGISEETGWRYFSHHYLPVDCEDIRHNGHHGSGVYEIYPFGMNSRPVRVFCDMTTLGGGWTAVQKRIDGSVSFEKNWADYKDGFGVPERDVWIGNDAIHQLTKRKNSSLYISITLVNGTTLYQLYNQFSISDEADKYQLFLAEPAMGTLGDAIYKTRRSSADLSGMAFSTPDRKNDRCSYDCASYWQLGWWMNCCYDACLNGLWSVTGWSDPWYPLVTSGTSVAGTMMLIKRH